ncbi:MAG: DJ-1/PfpI family protein [Candidatus Thorarchaeota archaeon]
MKDDMINAGAKFEDSPVVIDGNLITSRMPEDLPKFMNTVLEFLKK